jgi:cysteine desulfurase/selenocysteine lyase
MSDSKNINIEQIRADFPILRQQVNGKPLVYLDNGATTQKPQVVIDAIANFYSTTNSNVHRGAHTLSDQATQMFENARITLQKFMNAEKSVEIIWTRGTTDAINLVAQTWVRSNIGAGDEIIISGMEHHSNIVPWQMLCEQTGAILKIIPVLEDGTLDYDGYLKLLNDKTKFVAVIHVSNSLGTVNPVEDMVREAHKVGAKILLDGAQAIAHWDIDVQALDCDFYVFSGHKLFGPTGLGVLYGKEELLNAMPPYQGGGEMILHVSFEKTTYNVLPYKFEAGTPNIAGAIGMAAAVDYLHGLDRIALAKHEDALLARANELAAQTDGIRIIGTSKNKVSVLSFLIEGAHPNDVGTLLDQQGIAVRTGHHCTMPLMDQFKIPGTVRASFTFYNTLEEVDALFKAIEKVKMFLL